MLNTKTFGNAVTKIAKSSDELAEMIHEAGLYTIQQANEHRNIDPALKLIEALGHKHDKQRVVTWMCRFSIMRVSKGTVMAGKGVEANSEWLEQATNLPYWELTPQPVLKGKLDILAALKGVINRYNHAVEDTDKEWTFYNEDLLADIQTLITKKEESNVPVVKQKVTAQPVAEEAVTLPSRPAMQHSVRAH